ncbi:MAG: hypothetical protein PUH11_06295 [Bacilli bacterium]|nr:hypothetical protein [Bacilli bacterium]MDD7315319.1 hypothetical protein [Bacilli bacterium]MDY4052458.1 hypothetical protein [Bacilli bacterium]
MIQFYGYNDARAIAAYNKRNLTKMFLVIALICIFISVAAIVIPLYELLYFWGVFLLLLLIVLFASSFSSKCDDKVLKEKGIKTKHLFIIDELKLFIDDKEIKDKENINFYVYKKYVFLDLKEAYYFIPIDELTFEIDQLTEKLREVKFGVRIENIIQEIKEFIDSNYFSGDFTFTSNTIVWKLGIHRFTFYVDYDKTIINLDKLKHNKRYSKYKHYHLDNADLKKTIKAINERWGK